jgi:DegV family protein with EDD domain
MGTVRIVTDSTADIPEDIRKRLNIEVVPLKVHIGSYTFIDSVTLAAKQFYDKLAVSTVTPTTSQPSPIDFLDTYKRLAAADPDTQVISIHISSALSGTYQSAMLAGSMMEEALDLTILDSKSASFGLGIRVVRAAEAAQAGSSKEEIVAMLSGLTDKFSLYFLVDTLQHLHKGGRIGKAAAVFGSLLNIKPILSIDESGEIMYVDKVRGQKKAMNRIIEMLGDTWSPDDPMEIGVSHADALPVAEELSALIRDRYNVKKTTITWVGPVVGTHAGPGTVAVFIIKA